MTDKTKGTESVRPDEANSLNDLAEFTKVFKAVSGDGEKPGKDDDDSLADDGDEGQQGGARKPAAKSKPKDLKTLAERLELEDKDVYAVEIPSSRKGEKPYTIGGLKDLAAKQDSHTVATLQLDSDRQAFEAERVEGEQELRAVLDHLPKEAVTPAAMDKIREVLGKRQTRERALMLETIPEWSDDAKRLEDLKGMTAHLKTYGVSGSFLMANFTAATMRYVRDNWRRAEMVKQALEAVQERKSTAAQRSKPAADKSTKRADSGTPLGERSRSQVAGFLDTIGKAANPRR